MIKKLINPKGFMFVVGAILVFTLFFQNVNQHSSAVTSDKAIVTLTSAYDEERRKPFDLGLLIQNAQNVAGGVVELTFDESQVKLNQIKTGDMIQSENFLVFNNLEEDDRKEGTLRVSFASAKGVSGDGTLLEFEFEVSKRGAETPVKINHIELYNESSQEVLVDRYDGAIQVFKGKVNKKDKAVDRGKEWKVNFSIPMHRSSFNKHTVYVVNKKTDERVPVQLDLSSDGKTLTVKSQSGYSAGDYTLFVTSHAKSPGGRQLKEPVKMEFTVE